MKIYIKNIVFNRCIEAVRKVFKEYSISYDSIELVENSNIEGKGQKDDRKSKKV